MAGFAGLYFDLQGVHVVAVLAGEAQVSHVGMRSNVFLAVELVGDGGE